MLYLLAAIGESIPSVSEYFVVFLLFFITNMNKMPGVGDGLTSHFKLGTWGQLGENTDPVDWLLASECSAIQFVSC